MGYTIDLTSISVAEYKRLLGAQNLLPGRRILLDRLDARFEALERLGLKTVAQLKSQLSTPQKLAALSEKSAIPEDYLTILRRELGSLEQKPVPLFDFPEADAALIAELNQAGIRNSKEYWERFGGAPDELLCLCDLVRINGVGAVAARAFCEAGFRSVQDVAGADAAGLLARVTAVNEQKKLYNAKLGEKDMQFCIDYAKLLLKYAGSAPTCC